MAAAQGEHCGNPVTFQGVCYDVAAVQDALLPGKM